MPEPKRPPYYGTRIRSIRIDDDLWNAAQARARETGTSVTEVIRAALESFVR